MREHDELGSKFNYGISYLQAIRKIEDNCIMFARLQDHNGWLREIKIFYRELNRRMKPDERIKAKALIIKCHDAIDKQGSAGYLGQMNMNVGRIEQCLEETECYLKNIMTLRGMDLPVSDDPGDSFMDEE